MDAELIAVGIGMFALGFSLGALMCMVEIRRLNSMIDIYKERDKAPKWEYTWEETYDTKR